MFENPALFLKIFGIFAALAMIIYRFQVFQLLIKVIFKREDKDIVTEQKIEQFLQEYKTQLPPSVNQENTSSLKPDIHLLKSVLNNDELILYLVNRGGAIYNLAVSTSDADNIKIQPAGQFLSGDAGYIKIKLMVNSKEILVVSINYIDGIGNKHLMKLTYSRQEDRMSMSQL